MRNGTGISTWMSERPIHIYGNGEMLCGKRTSCQGLLIEDPSHLSMVTCEKCKKEYEKLASTITT